MQLISSTLRLFLGCLIILAGVACSNSSKASGSKGDWKNPVISCQLKPQEDPVKQFPESTPSTAAGLEDFCNRMQERFRQSAMTETEAAAVYQVLHKAHLLNDASYGMPGPGVPPAKTLTLQDYQQRVAIRKIGKNEFELFYSYTNCGTNYAHSRVKITNGTLGQPQPIESWSGSFPC